jgi:deoxyribose-phosphate aldolase
MTTTRIPDTAAVTEARELLRLWDGRPGPLGNLLGRVTPVGKVAVEERVAALKTRSIKTSSKLWAIDLAISMVDLTTLEGKDTSGRLQQLCAKAVRPLPGDPTVPHVAAACVYPAVVAEARTLVAGSGVRVASVATGFPAGKTFRDVKLLETREAVAAGPTRWTWSSTLARSSPATTRRSSTRSSP